MPLDGNGNYTLPAGVLGVPGELISSAPYNALLADIQAVLNLVLYRDGQAAATADLNMGNHKVVTAAAATSASGLITKAQLDASAANVTALTSRVTALELGPKVGTTLTAGQVMLASGTVVMLVAVKGNVFQIINNTTAAIAIQKDAALSMFLAGTTLNGNRTLAANGWATVIYVEDNAAVIAGVGLT